MQKNQVGILSTKNATKFESIYMLQIPTKLCGFNRTPCKGAGVASKIMPTTKKMRIKSS